MFASRGNSILNMKFFGEVVVNVFRRSKMIFYYGKSCRFAIGIWFFILFGRVKTTVIFFSAEIVIWTTFIFSGVNSWYSRIWLGMSCRCVVIFILPPWGLTRVEQWRLLSSKACHLNFILKSKDVVKRCS